MTTSTHELTPNDILFVAHPKRVIQTREATTLTIHYGDVELNFDDRQSIEFGEKLLEATRFRAAEAVDWSGAGASWDEVKELLTALVSNGYLAKDEPQGCPFHRKPAAAPPPEEPRYASTPRTFDPAHCAELSREIFGVEVGPENIESLMRANRLAHSAVDETGRQLGDENTYPPELQLHVATEYRTCPYSGSRYKHERPMNVTALKLVIDTWPELIRILHVTKKELLSRRSDVGPLSLVEIYVYATAVLSLPSYQLHRPANRIENGAITRAISGVYRAIDGTAMTARKFMFPGPKVKPGSMRPTVEDLVLLAETEALLFSPKRVCAGPPHMIEELLTCAIAPSFDEAKASTSIEGLDDLPAAFDYGLLGCELETWFELFWVWQGEVVDELERRLRALGRTDTATVLAELAAIRSGKYRHVGAAANVSPSARPSVIDSLLSVVETCRRLRGAANQPPRFELPSGSLGDVVRWFHDAMDSLESIVFGEMEAAQDTINVLLGRVRREPPIGPSHFAKAWPEACARTIVSRWIETTRSLPEPRQLDDAEMQTLRRMFARTRYSIPSALWSLAGQRSFDTELEASRSFDVAMWTVRGSVDPCASALDVLVRLFMLGESIPVSDMRWLSAEEVHALEASGLLVQDAHTGRMSSPFAVGSVGGIYFVTDSASTMATKAGGLVMPAYNETYYFAAKIDRSPAESALDLCTGSGIHALLASRHCARVVGVDISHRAIRFAEFNRRLNGVDNVRFVQGNGWEPIGDARFDRITVNPPYQPDSSAAPGENWWGAGARGDAVIDVILRGLGMHLAPNGVFQMVGDFLSFQDRRFETFVHARVGLADAVIAYDTTERPLAAYRSRYPEEPLDGLSHVEYGVVTISRDHGPSGTGTGIVPGSIFSASTRI